ncbi:hypothetical protein BS17DRAFT_816181 [Gyrodon lividus]|nr:hypothetical protein BS17DRAFT_816181 [Gyrodon lividus]
MKSRRLERSLTLVADFGSTSSACRGHLGTYIIQDSMSKLSHPDADEEPDLSAAIQNRQISHRVRQELASTQRH